jgi:hypothetical protein
MPLQRLAMLASLWNLSAAGTRADALRMLVATVGSSSGDAGSAAHAHRQLPDALPPLCDLPTHAYGAAADALPPSFLDAYLCLAGDAGAQVSMLRACWERCTDGERAAVLLDMRAFFGLDV